MDERLAEILKDTSLSKKDRYWDLYYLYQEDPLMWAKDMDFKDIVDGDTEFGVFLQRTIYNELQKATRKPVPPWIYFVGGVGLLGAAGAISGAGEVAGGLAMGCFGLVALWAQVVGRTKYRLVGRLAFVPVIFFLGGMYMVLKELIGF